MLFPSWRRGQERYATSLFLRTHASQLGFKWDRLWAALTHAFRFVFASQTCIFGISAALEWCETGLVSVLFVPLTGLGRQHEATLRQAGLSALALSATTEGSAWTLCKSMMLERKLCALILSPEALVHNSWLLNLLKLVGVGLVAFDEAHLWEDWRSWRPTLEIAATALMATRRLGLTATLTKNAEAAVAQRLGMSNVSLLRGPFSRPNLIFRVSRRPAAYAFGKVDWHDRENASREIDYRVRQCLRRLAWVHSLQGNAIIYVHSRSEAERLASTLSNQVRSSAHAVACSGMTVWAYHAGRSDRREVERLFADGVGVVVVATVAFGLGIDCAWVRLIIHFVSWFPPIWDISARLAGGSRGLLQWTLV